MNDKEIISLLDNAPEEGMEQIITQYSGLLWAVVSRHISQPEDIRECVNDTYAEFFRVKDDFDESKGSLKSFLAVIAQRQAIKKYHENIRSPQTTEYVEETSADLIADFEQKEDIERYLRMLAPVDEKIIRMKYYDGLSAKEIAALLDIPYETVKKRHQRSLKKLRKYMTLGIILAILAALLTGCVWLILRYFGIIPGYGVSKNPDMPTYIIEESCSVKVNGKELTITDAWWKDEILIVDGLVKVAPEDWNEQNNGTNLVLYEGDLSEYGFENDVRSSHRTEEPYTISERVIYRGMIADTTADEVALTMKWNEIALELVLKKAKNEMSFEQAGYYEMTENDGGLLAVPRIVDGNLIVGIYPLSEGEYKIEPALTKGIWEVMGGENRDITATAEDGTILTGQMIGHPFSRDEYYEWNFGPAKPGKYTLNIPYVFQYLAEPQNYEPAVLSIDMKEKGGNPDVSAEIPGAVVSVTDMEMFENTEPYADEKPTNAFEQRKIECYEEMYSKYKWWNIDVSWENTDPERTVVNIPLSTTGKSVDAVKRVVPDSDNYIIGMPVVMISGRAEYEMNAEGQTVGYKYLGEKIGCYYGEREVELLIDQQGVCYRWDHPFTIEFEVE